MTSNSTMAGTRKRRMSNMYHLLQILWRIETLGGWLPLFTEFPTRRILRNSLSLDGPLKGVARAECGYFPSRDPHLLPRLWVPALTGLLLPNVELPKAHDLDLVPAFERIGHDLLEGIEVPLGLALRCVGLLSERLDQLCFVHRCSSL